jgi:hypothetical protein
MLLTLLAPQSGAEASAGRPKIVARRKQLRDKPAIGTRVDFTHPLTQGLACAYFLNERGGDRAFDALGGTLPLTGTDTTWNNRGTVSFNGTTSRFAGDRSVTQELPTNAITIVIGVLITANPTDGAYYYAKLNDFADASWGVRSQVWNTFTDTQARIKISGTQQTTPNGNCSLTANVPYILVARWASGDFIDLFVFDRRTNTRVSSVQSSATYSGSITYDTRGVTIGRQILSDNSGATYIPGEFDFALTSARRWSDAEIQRFISTPFEILSPRPSPLILVADSGGSIQNITTAAPTASTEFYNATVSSGAATIVTDAPSASTTFYNAAITAQSTIVTASPVSDTSFYNATVSASSAIVTAAPTSSVSFYNATVTPGTVTVTTAAPSSSTAFYDAVVSNGGALIVTNAPTASTSFYNATVTPGVATISTATPTASTTFYNATVSAGAVTITTAAPAAGTTFYDATVSQGSATIVTAAPTASTAFYNATVSASGAIVTASPSASTAFYNATVTPGVVTISTAAPASSASFYPATILQGQTIATAAPSASTSFFNATVSARNDVVTAAPVSGTTFFNPSVTAGSVAIVTGAPTSSAQFFSATVSASNVIEAFAIASGGTFYPATIIVGSVAIEASRIESSTAFFGAVVDGGLLIPSTSLEWVTSNGAIHWKGVPALQDDLQWSTRESSRLAWKAQQN